MMKTLSLHMQANNGVSTNMESIRCTFCEISNEFYSTSTEFLSKKLLLLITIFIIMPLYFVV
jgi:hypothetical protein